MPNIERRKGYTTYLGGLILIGRPNYIQYKGSIYTCSVGEFHIGEVFIEKEIERKVVCSQHSRFSRGGLANFFKSAIIRDKLEITDFYS